jgi:hypothetical protein
LVRAGTVERLRGPASGRDRDEWRQRVRSGSLLVLCAWSVFVVAGAGFAKFAEHWDAVTPTGDRRLPADAFGAVQGAALVGAAVVLVGAVVTLPAFARSMREGGWAPIRRPVLRAAVVTSATVLSTVGIVAWAHHLGPGHRNGARLAYVGAGAVWALMVIASVATCSAAAVAATRRLRLPVGVLRLLGTMAVVATGAMVVIIAGVLVWWGAVATSAPWFFGSGVVGSGSSPVPPPMVVAGALMVLALVAALLGAGRVTRSLPRMPSD